MAGLVKGALIGGAVGAVAALLLAPKPGRELRQDLVDTYNKSMEKSKQWASDAGSKTSEIAQKVSQQATDLVGQTKSVISSAKDGLSSAKDGLAAAKDDIHSSIQDAKPN